MFPFCIFQKHQKTFSFFSEGIKQEEPEMGWLIVKTHQISNTSCRKKVLSKSSKKYALRFWLINIFPLTHQRPKKPPEGFYKNRCSSKFRWFYRKSPVLESGLQFYYKRDSSTGVFCEDCEILKNTYWLPLQLQIFPLYKNHSVDLQFKWTDWFQYDWEILTLMDWLTCVLTIVHKQCP